MRVQSKRSYVEATEMADGSFIVKDSMGEYRVPAKHMWTVFEPADDLREKLTRALTAQAWATACAFLEEYESFDDDDARPDLEVPAHLADGARCAASIGSPAELAEELLR